MLQNRIFRLAPALLVFLSACGSPESPPAVAAPGQPANAAPAVAAQERAAAPLREVSADVAARLDVRVAAVTRQPLARNLDVVGTVAFDENRVALAGPRLAGRVVRLGARPGQAVQEGEVLAELESVDLAKAGAHYLAQKARARAASANATRERDLHKRQVSSAREREVAIAEEEALAAEVAASEQLLLALGLRQDELPTGNADRPLARFAIRSPIAGVVVERPVVLGQAVDAGDTIAKIADLQQVWVNLDVFERDLAWVHPGMSADLAVDAFPDLRPVALVRHIAPDIDASKRTARVQLDVANPGGQMRPGQFVSARLKSEGAGPPALTVPRDALQMVDGKELVFVRLASGGFAARQVTVGSRGSTHVEILSGLDEAESVATTNAFLLKSEVLR